MRRRILIFGGLGTVMAATLGYALRAAVLNRSAGKIVAVERSVTWGGPGSRTIRVQSDREAVFHVRNMGGSTVHIHQAESGCGCAAPRVEPSTVPPGGTSVVHVVVTTPPAIGEKVVPIILSTDSPITPEVVLHLRLLSDREPPYVFQAGGDLTYTGWVWPDEPREIQVATLERLTSDREPILKSDLPFLRFEAVGREEGSPNPDEPTVVSRLYTYRAVMTSAPPEQTFAGEVSVIDPWDESHVIKLMASGRIIPPVRVAPSQIILRSEGREAEARFVVLAHDPLPGLTVEPEQPDASPLIVERLGAKADQGQRFHSSSDGIRIGRSLKGSTIWPSTRRARMASARSRFPSWCETRWSHDGLSSRSEFGPARIGRRILLG